MNTLTEVVRRNRRVCIACVVVFAVAGLLYALFGIHQSSTAETVVQFDRLEDFVASHGVEVSILKIDVIEEANLLASTTYQRAVLQMPESESLSVQLAKDRGPAVLSLTTKGDSSADELGRVTKLYVDDFASRIGVSLESSRAAFSAQKAEEESVRADITARVAALDPSQQLLAQSLDAELARSEARLSAVSGKLAIVDQSIADAKAGTFLTAVGPREVDVTRLAVKRLLMVVTATLAGALLAFGLIVIVWLTQNAPPAGDSAQ
jgi:hypothetical protein